MEFRFLGPVEVIDDGRPATPRRAKQRALLAFLLLHANEAVPTDRLIEALWGDEPPATAAKALQGHIAALRKLLGARRIVTGVNGYRLRLEPGELDAAKFEAAVEAARAIRDPVRRAARLAEALRLWRGSALADVRDEAFALAAVARLEELRWSALEAQIDAELEAGRHAEVIADLERMVEREPLREKARGQLMLALYRSGRQAEALGVYQAGRRRLRDELGLDPGPTLQDLQRKILNHDPDLAPPPGRQRSEARQERRRVTVLVAEVVGGPPDPEDLTAFVAPVLERAAGIIDSFGGAAQPLFANALVGIFGAPVAHEDDVERAVRTALAVSSARIAGSYGVRVGVETGEALITIDDERVEVTGDVVGMASVLEARAEAGMAVVGPVTHAATLERIEYTPLGADAWQARAPSRPVGSPAAAAAAPFVGRRQELRRLERALERSRSLGQPRLAVVVGEPGAGKTRLIEELRASVADSGAGVTWRHGRCLPYGEGVTFWALGEMVKDQAGILESDGTAASSEKLGAAVAELALDSDEAAWLERSLEPLVGVSDAAGRPIAPSGAWSIFFERLAARQPLVLVFEDLQWADASLIEFVERLTSRGKGPLLVIVTARPEILESHPGLVAGKRAETLALQPLDTTDTANLLSHLLRREPTSDEIKRTGGNPLFVHELSRLAGALPSSSEQVGASPQVPETLRAIIAARLDTLPPELKSITAGAAVIGEVFWSHAIASVEGLEVADVERRLEHLAEREIIRQAANSSVAQTREYAFLHVLVRDVAYGQIPRAARARRHEAAARWIEQLAGGRVTDHAEFLAHHCGAALAEAARIGADTGRLAEQTRRYLVIAGDRAMGLNIAAAERFYRRALDLPGNDPLSIADVNVRLGDALTEAGRLGESTGCYEQAIAEFTRQGMAAERARALTRYASALWRSGDNARTVEVIDEALQVLTQRQPSIQLARAIALKVLTLALSGNIEATLAWTERGLAVAGETGALDVTARILQYRGATKCDLDRLDAIDDLEAGLAVAREAGLGIETALGHGNLASATIYFFGPIAALPRVDAAIEQCEKVGLAYLASHFRFTTRLQALVELGQWAQALAESDAVLGWDNPDQQRQILAAAMTWRARSLLLSGDYSAAVACLGGLLPAARAVADLQILIPALAVAAAIQSEAGDLPAAVGHVREIETATRANPAWRTRCLPDAMRAAIAAREPVLAETLLRGTVANSPRCVASTLTAAAALAESCGRGQEALDRYADSARLWETMGFVTEEAMALLGESRSLRALGRSAESRARLVRARSILAQVGAKGLLLGEADR